MLNHRSVIISQKEHTHNYTCIKYFCNELLLNFHCYIAIFSHLFKITSPVRCLCMYDTNKMHKDVHVLQVCPLFLSTVVKNSVCMVSNVKAEVT